MCLVAQSIYDDITALEGRFSGYMIVMLASYLMLEFLTILGPCCFRNTIYRSIKLNHFVSSCTWMSRFQAHFQKSEILNGCWWFHHKVPLISYHCELQWVSNGMFSDRSICFTATGTLEEFLNTTGTTLMFVPQHRSETHYTECTFEQHCWWEGVLLKWNHQRFSYPLPYLRQACTLNLTDLDWVLH